MKVAVIQFLGTNCEYDTKYAFEKLGAEVEIIWHKDESIAKDIDLVVIPGGFSYGDYLRSGAIARFAKIMNAVKEFAGNGGKVLGICNGFQVLLEAHLLPGAMKRNDNLHFISKHNKLKVINNDNEFLQNCEVGETLNIPIAHHDGNYFIDDIGLEKLVSNNQILLKYCDDNGEVSNVNGSVQQIAGICNEAKNVFGLMPHPERAMEEILGSTDGVKMLQGLMK